MHAVRSGCVPISSAPARTPSTISWGTRCLKHRRRFASSWEREMRIHLEPVFTTVGSANRAPSEEKLLRGAFGAEFDARARRVSVTSSHFVTQCTGGRLYGCHSTP